jgi:hypothetical protein
MLLMVLMGELVCEYCEANESALSLRHPPLLALEDADDAEDDLRNEVRSFCGEKRAVMDWRRGECIFVVGIYACLSVDMSNIV